VAVALKFDGGKPDVSLVEPKFVLSLAEVLTFGARKYGRDNWKLGLAANRSLAAAYRHLLSFHDGAYLDSESGLPHLSHAAVNLMFLHHLGPGRGAQSPSYTSNLGE